MPKIRKNREFRFVFLRCKVTKQFEYLPNFLNSNFQLFFKIMDKDLINKRFNEAILWLIEKSYAKTKFEISNKLVITPTKLSEILSGRLRLTTEIVARLAQNYPQISLEWIMLGEGLMEKNDPFVNLSTMADVEKYCNSKSGTKKLPLLPVSAVAGWNGVDAEGINIDECDQMVVPYLVDAGAEFLIRVTGNSMYPTYANGDILACRRVRESRNIQWGKVYVIDSEEGPMVKRLKKSDDENCILCCSDNSEYEPFTLLKSAIRSISLVVGSIQVE